SEVAWRLALRPLTVPASWMAPPNSSSFSVSVVLPASGCEMIANVRRRSASCKVFLSIVVSAIGCVLYTDCSLGMRLDISLYYAYNFLHVAGFQSSAQMSQHSPADSMLGAISTCPGAMRHALVPHP